MNSYDEPQITPYLLYSDVSAALDFLEKSFGCSRFGDTMKDAEGRITHAAVKFGSGQVMLGCPGPGYTNPRQLGNVTHYNYVMVEKVDSHFEKAKSAGAEIVEELEDTHYGHRRYLAMDPEGHHWAFAEVIER